MEQKAAPVAATDFGEFDFRLRFVLPITVRLPFRRLGVVLDAKGATTVRLRSAPPGTDLSQAEVVGISGGPYPTAAAAHEAGEEWGIRLRRAFSAIGVAARFDSKPFELSDQTIAQATAELGRPVIPDDDGVITYASRSEPIFLRLNAEGTFRPDEVPLMTALHSAHAGYTYQDNDHLAYRLWAASHFVGHVPEARFSLLMISLECLARPADREGSALRHVEQLIQLTKDSKDLTDEERQPITGALAVLRRQSVRTACIKLAATMADRTYGGRTSERFVKHCYNRRNALVHVHSDSPSAQEGNALAGDLSRFVGDLLAGRPLVEDIAAVGHQEFHP